MQFHELKPNHTPKKKKRVGRGGKKGTFSGRGVKGQKARAGSTPRPALRDIVKKFPKKRGYTFNPLKTQPTVLNLEEIEKKFSDGEVVDLKTLKKKNIVKKQVTKVKILGQGELKKKLTFKGQLTFSKSAREKIKKSGSEIATKEKEKSTLPKKERQKKKKSKSNTKKKKTKKAKKTKKTKKTKKAKKTTKKKKAKKKKKKKK